MYGVDVPIPTLPFESITKAVEVAEPVVEATRNRLAVCELKP